MVRAAPNTRTDSELASLDQGSSIHPTFQIPYQKKISSYTTNSSII